VRERESCERDSMEKLRGRQEPKDRQKQVRRIQRWKQASQVPAARGALKNGERGNRTE